MGLPLRPQSQCTPKVRMNNGCFAGESVVCPNIPLGAWPWDFGARCCWSLLGRGSPSDMQVEQWDSPRAAVRISSNALHDKPLIPKA